MDTIAFTRFLIWYCCYNLVLCRILSAYTWYGVRSNWRIDVVCPRLGPPTFSIFYLPWAHRSLSFVNRSRCAPNIIVPLGLTPMSPEYLKNPEYRDLQVSCPLQDNDNRAQKCNPTVSIRLGSIKLGLYFDFNTRRDTSRTGRKRWKGIGSPKGDEKLSTKNVVCTNSMFLRLEL